VLPGDLAQLYARALVSVARADHEIGVDEGHRLQQRIEARTTQALPLDDLLLAEPLDPAEFAALLRVPTGPFRDAGVHPRELARMIVVDAIAVVLAKGHLSEEEARQIVALATALGCSIDDVRAMTDQLEPWLPTAR